MEILCIFFISSEIVWCGMCHSGRFHFCVCLVAYCVRTFNGCVCVRWIFSCIAEWKSSFSLAKRRKPPFLLRAARTHTHTHHTVGPSVFEARMCTVGKKDRDAIAHKRIRSVETKESSIARAFHSHIHPLALTQKPYSNCVLLI